MTFPFPPGPNQPIPNSPFYSSETNYIKGEYGPFIVGSGFYINNITGTIETTGTGGIAVTSLTASAGIYVSQSTGNVTIANTGVLALTAGNGINIVNNSGNYTITNTLPATAPTGTVTSITAGAGLTGGTITSSGTIALANSGVGPATYTNPTITVDQYGRITFATNGLAGGGGILATAPLQVTTGVYPQTISINSASTASPGAVQLNDTVTSTSTTQAATARALKETYDLASSSGSSATLALSTANAASVTANTACSKATVACNCAVLAYNTAVSAQTDADQALINAAAAQTTANTALTNSNAALANSATAQTTANTALATANNAIPKTAFVSKGQLLVGTSLGAYLALNPGTNGQTLVACSSSASGLAWSSPTSSAGTIPPSSPTIGTLWYNTGVTPAELQIWSGTSWVSATGGAGTVTSIATGIGLTGGPITTTGTISLANTSVAPGSYVLGSFTVDAKGRLTAASNGIIGTTAPIVNLGTSAAPNIGIQTATTGQPGAVRIGTNVQVSSGVISVKDASILESGVVQLNNTLTSNSTTQALTAAQGKALQDQINGLSVTSNLTLAGTFDAAGSQMLTVTADGTAAGFTLGANLPTAATGNESYFVIVTTAGSYNPPGGGGPYNANQGDWFLSNGTSWEYLNVGTDLPIASTGSSGIVQLATVGQTQTGTSTTLAVTPAGAASTYIPCASLTAKGSILTATAASTPTALPVGTNGQYLVACSTCASGLTWASLQPPSGTTPPTSPVVGTLWYDTSASPDTLKAWDGTSWVSVTYTGSSTAPTSPSTGQTWADTSVSPPELKIWNGTSWVDVATGTVTSITTGTGLTGGPITSSGTIALANTTVTAGTYNYATITVDPQGRLTAASTGVPPTGGTVTSITAGTGLNGGTITTTGTIDLADTTVIAGSYTYGSFTVDQQGRLTSAASGITPVTSITAGTGLNGGTITTTGTIDLANTTVTAGSYTYGSFTVDAQGRITAASSGTAPNTTVTAPITNSGTAVAPVIGLADTAVTAGSYTYGSFTVDAKGRLTAASSGTAPNTTVTAPITNSGTAVAPVIGLANTAVTAGSYTNASLTVDAQGRLTAASSGTAPVTAVTGTAPISVTAGVTPVVSIAAGSTTAAGAVQLYDGLNSSSTTLALTAAQGQALQNQITLLSNAGGVDLAGTVDASTGLVASVTSVGTSAGYTVGSALPAASATTNNTYVIVTNPGTMTPPGGSATAATRGDWFLVSQTSPGVYAWGFLNVGFDAPAATTSIAGIVCLSTNALAQAGTDTTTALTPAAAASAYIPKTCVTGKGALITGTAASTPTALTVGTDGQTLIVCAACPSGLTWGTFNPPYATPLVAGIVFGYGTGANSNTGIGAGALEVLSTGGGNTAVGTVALGALTSGCGNVAIGCNSLRCNTAGNGNVAIGASAGCLTTGSQNVAIGCQVQVAVAAGSCQLAIGFSSTDNWLTGNSTKAIKPGAGIIDCANSCGTAGQVLMSNGSNAVCWASIPEATPATLGTLKGCTQVCNTALGCFAALAVPTGVYNTAIGSGSLFATTTGCCNTGVGAGTLYTNVTGNWNVAVGGGALCGGTGNNNTAVGTIALGVATAANENTAVGRAALGAVTTGCSNTAVGLCAGVCITTGCNNVAIGCRAQVASPTGSCQLAIGFSLTDNWLTGDSTKAIRPGAGIIDCAGSCGSAGQILVSTGTNAICWSGSALLCGFTCTATPFNTALGCGAGLSLTTGACNTFIGFAAGNYITSGCCNVIIGTGDTATGVCATPCNNVIIAPRLCMYRLASPSSNNVAISSQGPAIYSTSAPANNIIQIGNTNHTNAYINVSWTPVSDIRDKTGVADIALGLDFINDLVPIEYRRCDRETGELNSDRLYYGFSAQEVKENEIKYANKNVIIDDSDENRLRITPDHMIPVLVNAIKELSAKVEELEAKLAANG